MKLFFAITIIVLNSALGLGQVAEFQFKKDSYKFPDTKEGVVLEHEFELIESYSYVSFLLAPVLKTYNEQFGVIDSMSRILFNKPTPTRLAKLWVNFQQKHDFNPIHRHGGAVSFVIWIDIPYDINVEKHHSSSKNSAAPLPGYFQFTYVNILGQISSHNIPADSKFKNQMVMFPAGLPHCVYPFRTSDEYRISVSGNFVFDT